MEQRKEGREARIWELGVCWMHFADLSVPERERGKRYILKITGGIKRGKKVWRHLAEHSLPWRERQANDGIITFGARGPGRLTMRAL